MRGIYKNDKLKLYDLCIICKNCECQLDYKTKCTIMY